MTPEIIITLAVIVVAMAMFVWNRVPAGIVATGATLLLFFTGILTPAETLSGFGDPVVILIIALLAIAVALENAGVGAWAGQLLLRLSRGNATLRLIAIMVVAAVFSGLIGMNGASAAMIPIVIVVAVRTGIAPSKLMIPLAFACLTGAKLTLLGTPVNVIAANQAEDSGAGRIGFFDWAILGVPQLVGTIVIVILFGRFLLPERRSASIPADFSAHAQTLVEQYRLGEGPEAAAAERESGSPLADTLISRNSGLVEVLIPPRSKMIGEQVFPDMTTEDGQLMILAVQRGGEEVKDPPITLRAGDHLLLQGTWKALEGYVANPHVVVVDAPETVKRQTVALGKGAPFALAILGILIVLLAFNLVPAAVAAVLCAALMVVTRVVSLPQLFRGIDWNTALLIGAMIGPAIAMTKTGAATMIGDGIVGALGGGGPYLVLLGLFLATALVSQFISNTSSALVMMPIGLATATELGVSALPMLMGVAMGASASFLTPFANGVSLIVYGPGGYRFGDFWRLGLIVMAWTVAVTMLVVPLAWPF
ncbi:MAG: SLC13 family permease [Microbacteriaceae bacterium]|nr:SLC13 family permease [Microbacteriaceae bacterium]